MSLNALLANHENVSDALVPDYIQNAPETLRRRICALKKLQLKTVGIQAEFYRRVHELETEFRAQFDAVNKQREQIINGKYEPDENESDVKLFAWMDDEQAAKFNETSVRKAVPPGIPDFWLNTLKNVPSIGDMVSDCDEAILKYLTDITVDQTNNPASFTLTFHFGENPFFTNTVLTKYYKLSIGPNELENEILYEGPSIVETKGCKIDWKEGKNVTEKVIKKKPKKGANAGRMITKIVPIDSFFRFFTPEVEKLDKELSEDVAEILNADFEAGQMIRDSIVDSAVLFYTGEQADDENDYFGEEPDDDDEQYEDDE